MENKTKESILEMINSSDKECQYLAVSILRNNSDMEIAKEEKIKLLKTVSIFDRIKSYSDVCQELDTKELTIEDFSFLPQDQQLKSFRTHQFCNISKLFNGEWSSNIYNIHQKKYYPFFKIDVVKNCLIFNSSYSSNDSVIYAVFSVFYKDQETSDFCGKLFLDFYKDIME